MSRRDFVLAQGIAAARAGDRQAARRLLAEAAHRDPNSELAWLWLSGVLETTQGRSYCLQRALQINPANQLALDGLQALEEARAARAMVVRGTGPEPGSAGTATGSLPASRPAHPRRSRRARGIRQWLGRAHPALLRAAIRERLSAALANITAAYRRLRGAAERLQCAVRRAPKLARVAIRERSAAVIADVTAGYRGLAGAKERRQRAAAVRAAARQRVAARRRATAARKKQARTGRNPLAEPRFWQAVVACLAVVALGLVSLLVYASIPARAEPPGESLAAVVAVLPSPSPHGTLRPTFTATATPTITPTPSPTPSQTPSPTDTATPTPTETPLPTATAEPTSTSYPTPQPVRLAAAAPTAVPTRAPTAVPRPTLPPRIWDPRLDLLRVRLEPVGVAEGQKFWRLVEARWADEQQSAGKHSIYVEVLDLQGRRVVGQPVIVQWADGNVALPVIDRPPPDWGVNFAMYNCLGSYAVSVGGGPSDRIVGLGLGTPETPNFTVHTSFYLVFRLTQR